MPNNFYIHIRIEIMKSDLPMQTVVTARKLGLLRKQKFCSQPTQWARGGGPADFVRGGGDHPCG
jgi:hypothetical protein